MNLIQALAANRRLEQLPAPSKQVAIVVPLSTRPSMSADEKISLNHLLHFLGKYDKFAVTPPESAIKLPDEFKVIRMDPKYFGSALAHSRMQLSPEFYEQFLDYEYILMYHLDALVFSDELADWCGRGYDFIGAPWFKTGDTQWVENPTVGNSGFCLMRVRSFLKVLYSTHRKNRVVESLERARRKAPEDRLFGEKFRAICKLRFRGNNVSSHVQMDLGRGLASDLFWSREAKHYYPDFRVATANEALPFAFEVDPAECFEKNSRRLPFGCHSWEKFDRAFWSPFLLTDHNFQSHS